MLLAEVVVVSAAVGGTRSRRAKAEILAAVLRALAPAEVEPVVGGPGSSARRAVLLAGLFGAATAGERHFLGRLSWSCWRAGCPAVPSCWTASRWR